jgi:hypothetical protein
VAVTSSSTWSEELARQSKKQGANHNNGYRNTGLIAAEEMKRRMDKAEGKETTAASRTIYRLGSSHVINCAGIFNSRRVRSRAPDQTK